MTERRERVDPDPDDCSCEPFDGETHYSNCLALKASRRKMSENINRLILGPRLAEERADIARRLHSMLMSILPPVDDEGNAAADVADGMIDALTTVEGSQPRGHDD